jgi:putative ABC transport system permease protein
MADRSRRRPFDFLRRRPDAVAAEVDEELAVHLEMRIEELRARGLPADEARREALRQFGDLDGTRRYCKGQNEQKETHMQRLLLLQDLSQDIRICARSLRRAPVLALTIVLTVGLGIGATTAIFAAVNAALLRPLPYHEPDRLVRIYTDTPPFRFRFSIADYLALREQQTQFAQTATYTDRALTYSDTAAAELVRTRVVSSAYLSLLGMTPTLGRDFLEGDERPGAPIAVIASHGFWERRLGGRSEAVGSMIRLDGADHPLVGILPRQTGPLEQGFDLFMIQQFAPPPRRGPFFYTVIARLKPGVEASVAEAEARAINKRIFPIWRTSYQDEKATWSLIDLKSHIVGDVSRIAGVALAAVFIVWLIACANASSLLVARVTSRQRELAVRTALGASRGRVTRHLLAESVILAFGSVLVGIAIAWASLGLLRDVGSRYFPRLQEVTLGRDEAWLLLALTVASAVLYGLVPALHGSRRHLGESLRASGRSTTGTIGVRRLRQALVGSQFAIATPLLVVAGLLLASLDRLRQVDIGFDTHNVVSGSIRLPAAMYTDRDRARVFWQTLNERLESVPGVEAVAFTDSRPPAGSGNQNNFDLETSPTPPGQSQPVTPWVAVTPSYFKTLGLPLLEGRLLDERDALTENLESIVVDRAWARRFFPNGTAVGKRLRGGGCITCPWTTVVGVVSEVKYLGLDQPDEGTVYTPMSVASLSRQLIARTTIDPNAAVPTLRARIREVEPGAPLTSVATIDELVQQSLDQPQSLSLLIAALAIVALLLSALGIYGVMTYYVEQHLKEIGIRMALGGRAADVLQMVIGQGMRVVIAGVTVGLFAALGLAQLAAGLLFGITVVNPATFAGVGSILIVTALAACAVPARRAVLVQPVAVLRND